jgi:hypothetical protein
LTLVERDGLSFCLKHRARDHSVGGVMNIRDYRINFDALLARIVYLWRLQTITITLLLIAIIGFGSGLIPPFWNGRATLVILAASGANVQIDGRSWPHPVYAGQHTILANLPDGRRAWADITLRASQALTLTMPAGLPEPRERSLPPAAPGTHIDPVWWADGAWRVTSVYDPPPPLKDTRYQQTGPTPTPQPEQTVAVSDRSVERLATLDAYAGLADQVHIADQLMEAVYRTNPNRGFSDQSDGNIEVRGWRSAMSTLPISAPLTLLRFAPDGSALLEAELLPAGAEQV